MRGLVKTAPQPGALQWTDWQEPVPGPGEVVIAVEAAGICGTDLSVYKWPAELVNLYKWPTPLLLGHEFAGRIHAVGEGAEGFTVGELVSANPIHACGECYFCRCGMSEVCDDRPQVGLHLPGAFAPLTKVRARNVIRIPDGVGSEIAALCEPLAVVVHALERTRFQAGESVVVSGAGPIGLLLALVARHEGAGRVFVTGLGRDAARLEIAAALGAIPIDVESTDPVKVIRAETGGLGADLAMEAGGHPTAVLQAISLVRKGGRIGLVGLPHHPTSISTSTVALQEKELIGCRAYTQLTWQRVGKLLPQIREPLARIITHRIPMEEGEHAFELALSGAGSKILLIPGSIS